MSELADSLKGLVVLGIAVVLLILMVGVIWDASHETVYAPHHDGGHEMLVPFENNEGGFTEWPLTNGCTTRADCVTHPSEPDGNTSHITVNNNSTTTWTDAYNVTFSDIPDASTVDSVTVFVNIRKTSALVNRTGGVPYLWLRFYNDDGGFNEYTWWGEQISLAYANLSHTFVGKPSNGGHWNVSDLKDTWGIPEWMSLHVSTGSGTPAGQYANLSYTYAGVVVNWHYDWLEPNEQSTINLLYFLPFLLIMCVVIAIIGWSFHEN